jgi:hypothetical protein
MVLSEPDVARALPGLRARRCGAGGEYHRLYPGNGGDKKPTRRLLARFAVLTHFDLCTRAVNSSPGKGFVFVRRFCLADTTDAQTISKNLPFGFSSQHKTEKPGLSRNIVKIWRFSLYRATNLMSLIC